LWGTLLLLRLLLLWRLLPRWWLFGAPVRWPLLLLLWPFLRLLTRVGRLLPIHLRRALFLLRSLRRLADAAVVPVARSTCGGRCSCCGRSCGC